jgi:diguanylate cyclase (GGDEF)-like protein/PAS domain S-box-containing protein
VGSEMEQLISQNKKLEEIIKKVANENKKLKMQFDSSAKLIKELNEFIKILLNLSPFGICIIQDNKFIFTNKAFMDVGNWSQKKVKDFNPLDLVLEEDREHVRKSSIAILKGETKSFFMFRTITDITDSKSIKWMMGSVAEVHMNGKPAIVGSLVDLTEERILQLAYNDTLTGLPNRKLMFDRLGQAIVSAKRRPQKLAVLFLDLDSFKEVNDKFGHKIGDNLLIEVAKGLQEVVKRESDTVARIGGDEFLILLTDFPDNNNVKIVIEKIFEKFSKPVSLEPFGLEINVSISIGVSIFPDHGKDSDTLISNADTAMYVVKNKVGKNDFHFFGT